MELNSFRFAPIRVGIFLSAFKDTSAFPDSVKMVNDDENFLTALSAIAANKEVKDIKDILFGNTLYDGHVMASKLSNNSDNGLENT